MKIHGCLVKVDSRPQQNASVPNARPAALGAVRMSAPLTCDERPVTERRPNRELKFYLKNAKLFTFRP